MIYTQRILVILCTAIVAVFATEAQADDVQQKKPEEAFMEMLKNMAAMGAQAGKAQGPEHEQAFKNLVEQTNKIAQEGVKANTPGPNGPSMEDVFGPFMQQLGTLAGASMGALGTMAEADLAKERAGQQGQKGESLAGKAAFLAVSGKRDEAEKLFKEAIEANPEDAAAFFGFAALSAGQGKNEQALASLKRAVAFNPRYAEVAARDQAFEGLAKDAEFQKLTGKLP
jgi:tetratricopeptide (TPR) repeat protein